MARCVQVPVGLLRKTWSIRCVRMGLVPFLMVGRTSRKKASTYLDPRCCACGRGSV
jgi:hypothetical protein